MRMPVSIRALVQVVMTAAMAGILRGQIVDDATDPNGVAAPNRFIHLVHSDDVVLLGTTGHLRARDPFLLYQLGRQLVHRQFRLKDGIYGRSGDLSVPLYSSSVRGETATARRFARDHTGSCNSCHSVPAREPGAGQTISSTGPLGRNTPHFFGAGLVEMISEQIRRETLRAYDANGNGRIDRAEVRTSCPVKIVPGPGATPIDFGDLAPGPDGVPQLNELFRIWYYDSAGVIVDDAVGLNDERVDSFNFAPQAFGWGRGRRQRPRGEATSEGAEASTLRAIFTLAADVHMGLQAHDPTQRSREPGSGNGSGGLAAISLNGAQQYDFATATDLGKRLTAGGMSLDDPDGDGKFSELTEGDVDAAEFYLLNSPAPAIRSSPDTEAGRAVFLRVGCAQCHVENWVIPGKGEERSGDRRFFDFATSSELREDGQTRVVGTLTWLTERGASGEYRPAGREFTVQRVYSDFRHWDIGPAFHERRFDGTLQKTHRTAPLWGVGSTAPYGHAGQFLTLNEVISSHAGAAAVSAAAYRDLIGRERKLLLQYLESLVLYATSEIPADLDGDGVRSRYFRVADQNVGLERFDPRFLFATPPRYRRLGWTRTPMGDEVPLYVITNVEETYGERMRFRRDTKGDGFPDVLTGSDSVAAHE